MSDNTVIAVIDSRIWLPPGLPKRFIRMLRSKFVHDNPDFFTAKSNGLSTWNIPRKIETFRLKQDLFGERPTIPRGGTQHLRAICDSFGYQLRWIDRRVSVPAKFKSFCIDPEHPEYELRYYQEASVQSALKLQQGICRAPTASGKTISALNFIYRAQQRAMVIMRDGNLLKQWFGVAQKVLGLRKDEIGIIRGSKKYKPGRPLVLALQQSLTSKKGKILFDLIRHDPVGVMVIDEAQTVASKTFLEVVDNLPCKYRVGFSADETRRDKKEFLIYDEMGPVIHEIEKQELIDVGVIHRVKVRAIPTNFRADWYRAAVGVDRNFNKLVDDMLENVERNRFIIWNIHRIIAMNETPLVAFTHRVEHARYLANEELNLKGTPCGLFLGGNENARRFEMDLLQLSRGDLKVGVGTYQAIGQGHDVPIIRAGMCLTPISKKNPQFFNQVCGRICRTAKGKEGATLYYLWDTEVYPDHLKVLKRWSSDNLEVFYEGKWISG